MLRAVMEGVAYNSKWLLNYVEKFISRKFDSLHFIGGGAKSEVWSQILADVLNKKIKQVEDPLHANVRGTAFLGFVSAGYLKWDDIKKLVKIKREYVPDEKNYKIYSELFKIFIEIYKKNKKIFRKLNR